MWKRLLTFALLLLLAALTAACDTGSNNVATATRYLDTLNDGDADAAGDLVCEERADDITAAIMTVSESELATISYENVTCQPRGDDVLCRYTIQQEQEDGTFVETSHNVIFSFENDLICGFEEQVAN